MLRFLAAAALLALTACANDVQTVGSGGKAPTSTAGTGGTAGGATGGFAGSAGSGGAGGGLPACDEASTTPGWQPFACILPTPCKDASIVSFYQGTIGTPFVNDPDAVTCILGSLRDRTISQFSLFDNQSGMGQDEVDATVFIVDADHAVSNYYYYQDLDMQKGTMNRQILKPPSYFDGCLQITDVLDRWNCMVEWSAGCDDAPVSCPAP